MANTLTNLIPLAYEALDVVSRELVGFIPSVSLLPSADRVAKGQTVYSPVAPANTAADITPAMTVTAASDQTISTKTLTVDTFKQSGFNWTGEEEFGINSGVGMEAIMRDQIAQAFRVHVNAIESALAIAAKNAASRGYGTAGTTPFASSLVDPANIKKILDDNGAPMSGRSLIINTTAGAALRTLAQLTKANEAADTSLLRQGTLLDIHGFAVRESAQVASTTKGTGTSYVLNGTHGVGATTITIKTGSGTVVAGDIITINSVKYVVTTGASAAGDIVIGAPGLLAAGADGDTVTISNTSARNIGLSRNAIQLATRLPKVPANDLAADRQIVTDPVSGIAFELSMYPGYRMVKYEVALAYGIAAIKPEHIAVLLG